MPPGPFPSGLPSVSAICAVVAEVNHFVPYSFHPSGDFLATVCVSPTSEPPVRSVIHCPDVQNVAGSLDVRWGRARWISSWFPSDSSVRAAPSVIASGHE